MSRIIRFRATIFTELEAHLRVPDHISDEDVDKWYRENGATGEFEEIDNDWQWGEITEADEDEVSGSIYDFGEG